MTTNSPKATLTSNSEQNDCVNCHGDRGDNACLLSKHLGKIDCRLLWFFVLTFCAIADLWSAYSFDSIRGHRAMFAQNAMIMTALVAGMVYSLGRRGWLVFAIISLLTSFFLLGEVVSIRYFEMKLTGDMLMMILGSSPGEMTGFGCQLLVKPVFWICLISFVAILCLIILLCRHSKQKTTESLVSHVLGLFFLVCSILICFFVRNPLARTTHLPFYQQCFQKYGDYSVLARFMKADRRIQPADVIRTYKYETSPFVCVVIGESATRDAWSLYGYPRETTPEMEKIKDELIIYKNVTACAAQTTEVMRYFLTCATPEDPSDFRFTLPNLLVCGGYSAALYSNQEHWGKFDGPISMLFHACSPKVYIKHDLPKHELKRGKAFDDDLLPCLSKEIETRKGPAVVFLHLNGSHIAWRDCAPKEYQKYQQAELAINDNAETLRNSYDNSIIFTDIILGQAIAFLKEAKRPTCLFYFSDHGDTPSSGKSRVAKSKETWNIPAILWCSPDFIANNASLWQSEKGKETQAIRSDAFFDLIQRICGVEYNPPHL